MLTGPKLLRPGIRVPKTSDPELDPAGNRGQDRYGVAGLYGRGQIFVIANVVFIHVHIDETPDGIAFQHAVGETLMLGIHPAQNFAHGGAFDFQFRLTADHGPQRRWYLYGNAHSSFLL